MTNVKYLICVIFSFLATLFLSSFWGISGLGANDIKTEKIEMIGQGNEDYIKWEKISGEISRPKWRYNSHGRIRSSPLSLEIPDVNTFTFSLFARSEKDGTTARLYMLRENKRYGLYGNEIRLSQKWQRYSLTGQLPPGVYWFGIQASQNDLVWGDEFQLEEGKVATENKLNSDIYLGVSIASSNDYVFFKKEKVPISIFIENTLNAKIIRTPKLIVSISNYLGQSISKVESTILISNGKGRTMYDFIPPANGWYMISIELKDGDRLIEKDECAVVIIEPPILLENKDFAFCGITGEASPGIIRIGSRWEESCLHWASLEPERGKYKWIDISRIHLKGLKTHVTISHFPSTPKWTWDPTEIADCEKMGLKTPRFGFLPSKEHMNDWRHFIHEFTLHYKGQIDVIEIGGEDDLTFGQHPYYLKKYPENVKDGKLVSGPAYERYAEMLKIACEEIRRVDPDVKIGIVRSSGLNCNFSSNAIKKCKNIFDLLPLDCYTSPRYIGPQQPETAVPEDYLPGILEEAINTCKTKGNGQDVYISEIGYALDYTVTPKSNYVNELIKRLTRMYLVARSTNGCQSLHWFSTDAVIEGRKYHYGLWRFGMPMPTVPAYSAVARIVENVKGSKELSLGGDSKAVVFEKNGSADAAVWFVRGDGRLKIQELPSNLVISDVMGNPLQFEKPSFPSNILCSIGLSDNPTILDIGEFPVYFSMKGNDAFEKLVNILSKSEMVCKPVKLSFTTPRNDKGILTVKNISGKDIEAIVTVNQNVKNLSLKKGKTTKIEVALDKNPINISVSCGNGYENVNASYPVSFESCQRINFKGKIDADLSKWDGRSFIAMNDRSQIMPPDPWIDYKGPEQFSAKVWTGWDDKYFYMAADVKDEIHSNNYAHAIYKADCIQFAFDPLADASKAGYDKDDKELGIALADNKVTVAQWAGNGNVWKDAEYAVKRNDKEKKTFYEMRIPLTALGISPEKGRAFGFNFVIFNDDTGAGANYYYQLAPGITNGKNPTFFKKIVFCDGAKEY